VDPPPLWGDEDHVRQLFEGTGVTLEFDRETWDIGHASVEAAVACYTTAFGPVVEARHLAEESGTWSKLREDLLALFARHDTVGGGRDGAGEEDGLVFPAEYLVARGRKEEAT
jgi:hypothetical protein